jgi:hypothetical protein
MVVSPPVARPSDTHRRKRPSDRGLLLAAALQNLEILLEGSRGYHVALLQQGDATAGEIETIIAGMRDQSEVLELIARHTVGMNEVADIDQISLKQLVEWLGRVSSELKRRDRPLLEPCKGMGNEPLRPQLLIDLAERGLPVVKVDELQFRLDNDSTVQLLSAVCKDGQFTALDIDLQEVDVVDLDQIVEAVAPMRRDHLNAVLSQLRIQRIAVTASPSAGDAVVHSAICPRSAVLTEKRTVPRGK